MKQYFGIELVKGSQKANWARRPLSPQMEAYARNDTHFLIPLAGILEARLRELGRWEWFEQSCAKAVATARIDKERDVGDGVAHRRQFRPPGRAAALLRALWFWRDAEARAADRPAFHVLQNEKLIEAAARMDRGETGFLSPLLLLPRSDVLPPRSQAALRTPPEEWPRPIRKPRCGRRRSRSVFS